MTVSVGAFEPVTRAMGPGLRACLWVRGCPMRCAGCATPEFIPFPDGHPYSLRNHRDLPTPPSPPSRSEGGKQKISPHPAGRGSEMGWGQHPISDVCELLDVAIAEHGITGISFSGGEPFAQAPALARIAEHARARGLSTLSWSGFTRKHLEGPRAPIGSRELLAALDVLIDGLFVQRRANGDPLRGSSNQRIHLLTDRHRAEEFAQADVEVRLGRDGRIVTTGVMNYAMADAALALLGVRSV
ncbi:MAG: 4Fe-4S single cluster domain-containing protein [bacterium]|nr:4Fe-4S single cluster domain-containing protein [bacterium]